VKACLGDTLSKVFHLKFLVRACLPPPPQATPAPS
jgi:hypothetical protein